MSRLTGVSARFGSAPVVLLLAASLGITALVTYEAQDAAREQKALAWRAIRAETAVAAERYRAAALLAQARGDAEPFASAWRSTPLLRVPAGGESGPALASQPNDSLLSVRVRMGRAEIFRSSPGYESEFRGAAGAGAGAGADGFAVEATLRQGVAERLLAGRLPTCRLGLLLPLLGANALLLGIAVQHYRRERERVRRRSEFVSGVSHELRTPLAQIRMFAETMLLDRMDRPDDRRRALGIITKETARLTGLIENILHFSRAERQAVAVRPEWTRVGAFVEEVVDGYRPLAGARGAQLRTELAPELDEAAAAIDRDGARQVLLNLLDNAVKYAPAAGDVLVRAGVAGGRLELAVDDAGPGIPPAERDRVWEPFYRLDRDRRGAAEGSGIGLAVVRRLAEAHGGSARIESSRRGGTRVIVTLGAVRPAAVPAREPAFAGAGAGAGTGAVAT